MSDDTDFINWLQESVKHAKFFLFDLTRKQYDTVAITDLSGEGVIKGVIVRTARKGDLGALWWTSAEDVQTGLEVGYFDISKHLNTQAEGALIPHNAPPIIREEFTHDHPVTPSDPMRPKKRP